MSETTTAINFMLKYTPAYTGYLSYTNRKNAVLDEEKNQELLQKTDDFSEELEKEIADLVFEQNLDFKNYVKYMDREIATHFKSDIGSEKTTAFSDKKLNLTQNDLKDVQNNLKIAQKNKSLLWQGVFSFNNQFLKDNDILDPETNYLNQESIKQSIQNAMTTIISRESLNQPFWWGNIHVNTGNIHVHIGLSEKKSLRPVIVYKNKEQLKGKFKQSTLKSAKSIVFNKLTNDRNKQHRIKLEKRIAFYKNDLVKDSYRPELPKQKQLINLVYKNLPENKKLWRMKTNAKEMKIAKTYINMYVNDFFNNEGKDTYDNFKNETRAFLEEYKDVYSTKDQNDMVESALNKRIAELKENVGNNIFKFIKENELDFEQNKVNKLRFSDLKELNSADLKYVIDTGFNSENLSTIDKQNLGFLKYQLRQRTLDDKITKGNEIYKKLSKVETDIPSDVAYIEFKKTTIRQENSQLLLDKKPLTKLSPEQKIARRNTFRTSTTIKDLLLTSTKKYEPENTKELLSEYQKELKMLNNIYDNSIVESVFGKDLNAYKTELTDKISVINIKSGMYQSNKEKTQLFEQKKSADHNSNFNYSKWQSDINKINVYQEKAMKKLNKIRHRHLDSDDLKRFDNTKNINAKELSKKYKLNSKKTHKAKVKNEKHNVTDKIVNKLNNMIKSSIPDNKAVREKMKFDLIDKQEEREEEISQAQSKARSRGR